MEPDPVVYGFSITLLIAITIACVVRTATLAKEGDNVEAIILYTAIELVAAIAIGFLAGSVANGT